MVTDTSSNTATILLGNGDGTFQSAPTITLMGPPEFVVAGDFDGDGNTDLAVAESVSGSAQLAILLGDGHGNFQILASYSTAALPLSVIAADVNGDARQDLVFAAGNKIGVLFGKGDGTFQPARYLPPITGDVAVSVAAADFNQDGNTDLMVVSHTVCIALLCPLDVELFMGNGDGTFQGPSIVAPQLKAYRGGAIVISDFNRDGVPDAVLESVGELGGTLTVFVGNGDGTFQSNTLAVDLNPVSPVAADLNGDSLPDLVVADVNTLDGQNYNISVLLNTTGVSTFRLSIAVNGSGRGVVIVHPGLTLCAHSCTTSFASGTTVHIGEIPDNGSNFTGWSGACSGTASCSLYMNSNKSISAAFNVPSPPDFSLSSSQLNPSTVSAGQSASSSVDISPVGSFNNPVSFVCSVQPSPPRGPTCSVSPATSSSGTNVKVSTTAATLASATFPQTILCALVFPLAGLFSLSRTGKNREWLRAKILFGTIVLIALLFHSACSGNNNSGSGSPGTPPGTYTVTVSGTAGTLQHSLTLTLAVQ